MNEEKIIKKLFEHDDEFGKLGKKIDSEFSKMTETLEDIATIIKRLDQERIFTAQWVKRIEEQVETSVLEIAKIKQVLKIG